MKVTNTKCKECIYDPYAGRGTWRQQVESCLSKSCPLYPVRPVSEGAKKPGEVEKPGK